ncbi:MAG: TonB-dependent receptor, partial [Steroidobacterales bacterium]
GHDLLNLRAGWTLNRYWTLRLRVNNVTNVAYADRADVAFGNLRYFPGRDRSVFLEIGYHSAQSPDERLSDEPPED